MGALILSLFNMLFLYNYTREVPILQRTKDRTRSKRSTRITHVRKDSYAASRAFSSFMRASQALSAFAGWSWAGEIQTNAWYAAAAFCNETLTDWTCKPCLRTPHTQLVSVLENAKYETQGYIATNPESNRIILSFRGTAGPIGRLLGHSMALIPYGDSDLQVHYGFYTAMQSLEDQFLPKIRSLLADNASQNYSVTVTGHSLGGAIATLAAVNLKETLKLDPSRIELFTYGQPQPGTGEFATWFNSLGIKTVRVANAYDNVPHLLEKYPLHYTHVGREFRVNGTSVEICDPDCLETVPFDHLRPTDHLRIFDTAFGDGSC